MTRLFVAIDVPDDRKLQLVRLFPSSGRGVRCTPAEQMHLTLHFLGPADVSAISASLAGVAAPAFRLAIEGVGTFASAQRGAIVWAGIRLTEELAALHELLAQRLAPIGFQPDQRPFRPHITLARCQPRVPRNVVQDFLEKHSGLALPEFSVSEFALYSSELTAHGPIYRREQVFPLTTPQ